MKSRLIEIITARLRPIHLFKLMQSWSLNNQRSEFLIQVVHSVHTMYKSETNTFSEKIGNKAVNNVIVDLDAGTDDAWALLMLLAAEARSEIKIVAITCVRGNTNVDNVCNNVLRILETVNRFDIPVYKGAERALIPPELEQLSDLHQFHGKDGFGDLDLPSVPDRALIQAEHAVSAINRITTDYHGNISLVCLGPLTNIALAMRTNTGLVDNVINMAIMGGNSSGKGNVTPTAEFNFYSDPEAAHIVLTTATCPIILLPWETCITVPLCLKWRFDVLGAITNKQMELMNAVERSVFDRLNCAAMLTCDQLLTAALLRPDIVTEYSHVHMSVELHGHRTRGQSVIDHLNCNLPNVILIEKVDVNKFKEMMLLAAGH